MVRKPLGRAFGASSTSRRERSLASAVVPVACACVVEALEARQLLAGEGLSAVYYNNSNLTAIAVKRTDPTVSFDWGTGFPDAAIEADSFSVRWSGQVRPQFSENYTFYVNSDDGVRVWVDDELLIDEWHDATSVEYSGNIELNAAQNYTIRVEYYEQTAFAAIHLEWSSDSQARQIIPQSALSADTGAPAAPALTLAGKTDTFVELNWTKPADDVGVMGYNIYRDGVKIAFTNLRTYTDAGLLPATSYSYKVKALDYVNNLSVDSNTISTTTNAAGANGVNAVYFGTAGVAGIKLKRVDSNIDFDWGSGSPDALVPPDGFSVRWTGKIQAKYTEQYTFHTITDDGVRLWVNNQLLIDNWAAAGEVDSFGQINLTAGQKYTVKMEFFDNSGGAAASLLWSSSTQAEQVVPASAFFADQSAPTAPAGLFSPAKTTTTVTLSWNAASDDVLVQAYNIFRNDVKIGQVTSTTFTDTGLTAETAYSYQVQSLDGYNNLSARSSAVAVTTNPVINGVSAVYYDNDNLSFVKVKRADAIVDFAWGLGSPDSSVGVDTFSARWTGKVLANQTGTHTFHTQSDDGVRLWVNNQLLIDNWGPHTLADNTATISLTAGQKYSIRLEYRDVDSIATLRLLWARPGAAEEIIPYDNLFLDLTAPATPTGLAATKSDKSVNLTWNAASDDVGVVFYNIYRDGVKITQIPVATSYSDTGLTPSTSYSYQVEAVDGFHRLSSMSSALPVTTDAFPSNGLSGVYFDNQDFTVLKLKRVDDTVDFDWGFSSPDAAIGVDSFSVYWTGFVQPQFSQTYTFYTTSDEGVRLYVNNQLLIDNFTPHGATENSGTIALTAGQKYKLRLEYFEASLGASINLSWSSPSRSKQIIPIGNLFPDLAAPAAPSNLRNTGKTDTTVSLAWNATTDNVGVRAYNVYRNGTKVGQTTDLVFTDTGLAASTGYSYTVAATDYALNLGAVSSAIAVTTNAPMAPIVYDAYSPIVAGEFDASDGATRNGSFATGLDTGDWIRFMNVDFGSTGAQSVRTRIGLPISNVGGRIEVRLDSPNSASVGALITQTTGSYGTFVEQVAAIAPTTGRHDVYLRVASGTAVGQIDTFWFSTQRPVKIMPLGDSITQAPGGQASYRYWLWKDLNTAGYSVNFVGSGLIGYTGEPRFYDFDQNHEGHAMYSTSTVLANAWNWANFANPDVVLLHIGTNDVGDGVPTNTIINNISQIIDVLRSVNPNVTILLAQLIPYAGQEAGISTLNAAMPGLASSKNTASSRIIVVDQYTGFNAASDTVDGIHPNEAGEKKMSARWYSALTGVL